MGLLGVNELVLDEQRDLYLSFARSFARISGKTVKEFNMNVRLWLAISNIVDPSPQDWINAASTVFDKFCPGMVPDSKEVP